jgi:hypothetical protein
MFLSAAGATARHWPRDETHRVRREIVCCQMSAIAAAAPRGADQRRSEFITIPAVACPPTVNRESSLRCSEHFQAAGANSSGDQVENRYSTSDFADLLADRPSGSAEIATLDNYRFLQGRPDHVISGAADAHTGSTTGLAVTGTASRPRAMAAAAAGVLTEARST